VTAGRAALRARGIRIHEPRPAEDVPFPTDEDAPPLTNPGGWKSFPLNTYDLVIIDSWDSFTEGVGEQDSAKPSLAQKVILDLAHRRGGPAFLIPANTVKSGEAGRGAGTLEDREDIVCEVRDATNVAFSGREDWWAETATGSRAEWAEQSRRRQHQQRLRLAFVYSKFRPGETPPPFAYEINFTTTPWSYRDVTADIIAEGKAAAEATKQQAADQAATAMTHLRQEVERRAEAKEDPYNKKTAAKFLTTLGLTWKRAHDAVTEGTGTHWRLEERHSERGKPIVLVPVNSSPRVPNNPAQEAPAAQGFQSHLFGTSTTGTGVPNRPPVRPSGSGGSVDDDLECGRKLRLPALTVEDVLEVFPGARIVPDEEGDSDA
jgi:hypothetical protein